MVEELIRQRDPRTGKGRLPWIEEVFVRNGTRVANFYVRGISLSAPSWAMLDTGQHQVIHGNVEYDRYTLRAYDYLNFFPFYTRHPTRSDMPGVAVLDEAGVPLIIDEFPVDSRFQSLELYQRGHRWRTLQRSLPNRLLSRSPRELFDEWQSGLELSGSVNEQVERELLAELSGSQVTYLDYFSGEFDHIAHLTNDRDSQARLLDQLDAFVGRVWTAMRRSTLADDTVLALVSDHGINSEPGVYGQGYSLLDWFGSVAGGGHHAITNRYPLTEYKIRGLNPLVSEVITAGPGATYLKGEEQQYPTAMFDLDGNEKAAVHLRNSALNILQILLQQMNRRNLSAALQQASRKTFFAVLDAHRPQWQRSIDGLREELAALDHSVQNPADADAQGEEAYGEYIRVLSNLLSLREDHFDPAKNPISELIPKRSMGESNTLYDLQNYIVGPAAEGLVTSASDPSRIDLDQSFRHIDYFPALTGIRVRNNVQAKVGPAPVDFIAVPLPTGPVSRALGAPGLSQAIWLYASDDSEALILSRDGAAGLDLRYLPVEKLKSTADGTIRFNAPGWREGLPLHLWEDPKLDVPQASRGDWLSAWHSEREWLRAIHQTTYSNGLIGITEQFTRPPSADQNLPARLEARRRNLVVPDMLIFAANHWNFNVRNFNPGGNHGSFFRISTHSLLMFAGGANTGVPRGLTIDEPYDSLSFAPSLLRLVGHDTSRLPGPVIDALFSR